MPTEASVAEEIELSESELIVPSESEISESETFAAVSKICEKEESSPSHPSKASPAQVASSWVWLSYLAS